MCTVVIRVGESEVKLLAVRDEDPKRPWRPLGHWWPDHPEISGIQDVQAGGAWLAHSDERLAVLLNRAGGAEIAQPTSRGGLVMGSVTGVPLPDPLTTLGFNLVEVGPDGARVTSWEGGTPRTTRLEPGTHMIAHDDLDDPATARIVAWRAAFSEAPTTGERWWQSWIEVLAESARELDPEDDRAIIRDNRPYGFDTESLLVCVASIDSTGVSARMAELARPGHWNPVDL